MRSRGARRFGDAAGLDHQHRLLARRRPRRRHELARAGDRLDVEQDRAGVAIEREIVEQVAEIDVDHVAERDHAREADRAIGGPVEHRRHHRSRLRHEREVSRSRRQVREAGVDAVRRRHESDAVGAHDAHAARACRVEHRALERGPLGPALAKPGGEDDHGAGAALGELTDDLGHRRRRCRDHREIGRERQSSPRRDGRARRAGTRAADAPAGWARRTRRRTSWRRRRARPSLRARSVRSARSSAARRRRRSRGGSPRQAIAAWRGVRAIVSRRA